MRKTETQIYWLKELVWILNISDYNTKTFNFDKTIYNRYISMQAKFAEIDGFKDIADKILTKLEPVY